MMNRDAENIKSELEELGCKQLIDLQLVDIYKKPDCTYFTSNLANIEEKGLLFPYACETVYEVPGNYFEDLSAYTSELVSPQDQGDDHLFSFETTRIAMPFGIPDNYFEQLRPEFLENEQLIFKRKEKARIVSFFQQLNKYVAAAVVLVLFSVGANIILRIKEERKAYRMLNNMDISNELADVPTEEIFNYLNQNSSKNMEYLVTPNGKNNPVGKWMPKNRQGISGQSQKDTSDKDILEFLSDEDQGF